VIRSGPSQAPPASPASALVDRVGQALGPGGSVDLQTEFQTLELPEILLERLRPPLIRLGFDISPALLPRVPIPKPPSYTLARNEDRELSLLHLPELLFGPTPMIAFLANGLGYAFGTGAQLHLFSQGKDAVPQFWETSMRAWSKTIQVTAEFHPWLRISELEAAPDPAVFVSTMFNLDDGFGNGDQSPSEASELTAEQIDELSKSLRAAFPDSGSLRVMLRTKMAAQLADISEDAPLPELVLNVIEWAKSRGAVPALIRASLSANPGNPRLRAFATAQGIPLPPANGRDA
jgi:hypothetical protein